MPNLSKMNRNLETASEKVTNFYAIFYRGHVSRFLLPQISMLSCDKCENFNAAPRPIKYVGSVTLD